MSRLVGGLALATSCAIVLFHQIAAADEGGIVTATVSVATDVSVELEVPDRAVKAGNPFQVEVRVLAYGQEAGDLTLRYPETVLLRGDDTVPVTVRSGRAPIVRWSACSEVPGQHILMATFEGAAIVVESNADVLAVEGKPKRCPPRWR